MTNICEDVSTITISSNQRDKINLHSGGDVEEVDNETNVLVPHNPDLVNKTEPTKIIPQLFPHHGLI